MNFAGKYERRVEQVAAALHEDCILAANARLALDPSHDPWERDRHYGQAHDLVRRLWPKLDRAALASPEEPRHD